MAGASKGQMRTMIETLMSLPEHTIGDATFADDDGFIDEEEIVEVAAQDSQDLPAAYRSFVVDDYFIGIFGHRGSGRRSTRR